MEAYDAAAEAIKVYEESFDSLSTTSTLTAITKALEAAHDAGLEMAAKMTETLEPDVWTLAGTAGCIRALRAVTRG